MGIKFGEVDVTQILDNEYRAKLALKLIEWSFNNVAKRPTNEEINNIKQEVVRELKIKYPNSGIELQD